MTDKPIKTALLSLAGLFLILTTAARAEDLCADVLSHKLGDSIATAQGNDAESARQEARCLQNSNSSSSGSNTSVGGEYDGFGLNFGQSQSGSNASRASDCGNQSNSGHMSAFLWYTQTINREVVAAWKACMVSRQQFACWAERNGSEEHIAIHINWAILSARPRIIRSELNIGHRSPTTPFAPNSVIYLGDNMISVARNANEDVTLIVVATPDNVVSVPCTIWIPAHRNAPPPVKAQQPVQSIWTSIPPLSLPPAPIMCTCVTFAVPQEGPAIPPVGAHAQNPPGSLVHAVNKCQAPVRIFSMVDTIVLNPVPATTVTPAPGRRFSLQSLLPGQEQISDVSGAVYDMGTVLDCPMQSIARPGTPFGPQPQLGNPFVPPPH